MKPREAGLEQRGRTQTYFLLLSHEKTHTQETIGGSHSTSPAQILFSTPSKFCFRTSQLLFTVNH